MSHSYVLFYMAYVAWCGWQAYPGDYELRFIISRIWVRNIDSNECSLDTIKWSILIGKAAKLLLRLSPTDVSFILVVKTKTRQTFFLGPTSAQTFFLAEFYHNVNKYKFMKKNSQYIFNKLANCVL